MIDDTEDMAGRMIRRYPLFLYICYFSNIKLLTEDENLL